MRKFTSFLVAAVAIMLMGQAAQAAVIADFNVNEGVFNVHPTFSGTTNVSSTSTADRVTTNNFEGAGNERIISNQSTASPARIRFVANSGTPAAGNIVTTTSAGVDGWVGFYYRVPTTGGINSTATVTLNLDDSVNNAAGMDMGTPKVVIVDGLWHLAEWNLDDNTQWDPVSGIGGDGTIQNGQHSIDSIYIQGINTGGNGTTGQIFFDFVAYNPTGSIANLVPEPGALSLLGLAGLAMFRRRK